VLCRLNEEKESGYTGSSILMTGTGSI